MKIEKTFIEGLLLITPEAFYDDRGYFMESFNEAKMKEYGIPLASEFVQDNQSISRKRTIRGMHMQKDCGKLVRVVKGEVLDIVIDLRPLSPTYGKYFSIWLNDDNKKMLWIPSGFAHGFMASKNDTIFCYKVTKHYNAQEEIGINARDSDLKLPWGGNKVGDIISKKDSELPTLKELEEKNILGPNSLRDKAAVEEEKIEEESIDPLRKALDILEKESENETELIDKDKEDNNEGQNNREELILPSTDKYSAKEYEIAPESK